MQKLKVSFEDLSKYEQVFYLKFIRAYCKKHNVPYNKAWDIHIVGIHKLAHGITYNHQNLIEVNVLVMKLGDKFSLEEATNNINAITHELYHAYVSDIYNNPPLSRFIHELDPFDARSKEELRAKYYNDILDTIPIWFIFTTLFGKFKPYAKYDIKYINPEKLVRVYEKVVKRL